jgi:predicted metal-dependent hydrolase
MKLEGIDIRVEKTPRRKTFSIFIERDGSVRVLAPENAADEIIENVIRSKEYLIFKKLARWKELNQSKVNREFVNGQSFLYLGRNYQLEIIDNIEEPMKFSGGRFYLNKRNLGQAEQVFKEFYKEKAKEKINERMKLIEEKFHTRPTSVKVLELRNRWASWIPNNGLNFHWKCAMAPVAVIDYIINHEMVHLKYPNHSPEFWDELDKKMPNYREYENWLKVNGVRLDL